MLILKMYVGFGTKRNNPYIESDPKKTTVFYTSLLEQCFELMLKCGLFGVRMDMSTILGIGCAELIVEETR
jgi:hypothetical protein